MSKLIFRNKAVFLLFLSIFFSVFSNAQTNIMGIWKIDKIIGIRDQKEYSLVRQNEFSHGNNLKMNFDGTFVTQYLAGCGNDCFTSSSGRYLILDDTHLRFILLDIHYSGWCSKDLRSESDLNKDLGIFYIYKEKNSIRLIKSNGILQDDKDKMLYTEMLESFDKNWKGYDYSWRNTEADKPEEIIKEFVDDKKLVDLSNYKIVFSKKEAYGHLFLVRNVIFN
jgi:hypothetical protein